jgi:hypothetical protein
MAEKSHLNSAGMSARLRGAGGVAAAAVNEVAEAHKAKTKRVSMFTKVSGERVSVEKKSGWLKCSARSRRGQLVTTESKKPPEGGSLQASRSSYFVAAEAESIADEAAIAADEAESIDAEAAIIDDVAAADEELSVVAGGVTMVVDDGGVVVVVSSFLLQAAKETAAASVTMSNAVFIFLLDSGSSDNFRKLWEPLWSRTPSFKDKESCGISRA